MNFGMGLRGVGDDEATAGNRQGKALNAEAAKEEREGRVELRR
jgi:hypothetical protein